MLTLDLKKSNNHDIIQGKLILNISTNVNAPIRNGANTLASGSRSITRNPSSQSISVAPPQPSQPQPQAPPPPHSAPITNASNTAADNTEENRNSDLPEG